MTVVSSCNFLHLFSIATTCTNDDIRISGGDNTNQGLVELCIDGKWTSICDDGWGSEEAKVVCKEAGFSTVGTSPPRCI